jgi:DNA polymerase-3 subunit epsilon
MNTTDTQLKDLKVLIFDCQATHSDPARGDVFEAGWLLSAASEPSTHLQLEERTETHLVKTPRSKAIPGHIQKITGLKTEDFRAAANPEDIWLRLLNSAKRTASKNEMSLCPAVIHFARYEEPFLRSFHRSFSSETEFPFLILCTHEMIRRLLPGLPRKGLRTTAGYFGHALPEKRRSRHHLTGTFHIWQHTADLLAEKEGISNLQELMGWLDTPFPVSSKKQKRKYPMAEKCRKELPDCPGVYRMYRSNGDLLYIGKAKSLKQRVNSYFRKKGKHSEHILDMLSQAKSLTHSVTGTSLEAALKESDEIKALAPPFNIALRASPEGPFFFSADFKSVRDKADELHRIGPLPTKKYGLSLSIFSDILNDAADPITREAMGLALDTPNEYLPEMELFLQGIEEFKINNQDRLILPATFQSLIKFGSLLWKEKIERATEKEEEAAEEEETPVLKLLPPETKKKAQKIRWTTENISKRLTHMVRVGTYLIRRARWYYLLTESSLAWEELGSEKGRKYLLMIRNGRPYFGDAIPIHQEIPLPPGCRKSNLEKQRNFDLFTYDRMGIVTTEIRRILKENRDVELRFSSASSLKSDQLKKILQWI